MGKVAKLPVVEGAIAPAPIELGGPLELLEPDEPLFDYVLERYAPRAPQAGTLRSVNALYAAGACLGLEPQARALVERVRAELGPSRTVFGLKHDDERGALRSVELYFYDWRREHADLSLARLVDVLSPFVRVDAREPKALPWHMLSVELDLRELARPGAEVPAHVYVDMRSYALRGESMTFENIYTFHDPKLEIDDLRRRIDASVYVDTERAGIGALLPPAMMECHKACFANKRDGDALYFSRVPTRDVPPFLRSRHWPASFVAWLQREAPRMAALSWDVGVDFTAGPEGRPRLRRSGLYGHF